MTSAFRTIAGATALSLLALPGFAQDADDEPDQDVGEVGGVTEPEREEGAEPGPEESSDVEEFTTFEPTDLERRIFDEPDEFTVTEGEHVYSTLCAGCHMPEGEGAEGAGIYPALADNPNLEFPEYAVNLVIYGQAAMPAFGDYLDDEQIANVVDYIRSSWGNDYVEGDGGETTPELVSEIRPAGDVDESGEEEHD